MLALPDPASNVTSDVVFTSKKECVCFFSVDNRAAKHCHSTVGCLYFHCFHVFPCFHHVFHIFHIGQTSWSSPCLRQFFDSERSWMNGLGKVKVRWEPKGCVEAQRLGVSNQGKVKLNADFEKKNTMKSMLGQDEFLLFQFQGVNCYHLADVEEESLHMWRHIVPSIALDDGGASTSEQMMNLRCIQVVVYMIVSLTSAWPKFFIFFSWFLLPVKVHSFLDWESMHQHLSSSVVKFPYPPCSICIGNSQLYHHSKHCFRVRFICNKVFFFLLIRHIQVAMGYHAIPCIAEARGKPSSSTRTEDVVRWSFGTEHRGFDRWRVTTSVLGVPQNHGMIPKSFPRFVPMMWSEIVALHKWPLWAQAAPKQHNLVTAIEVMPSTNEQACIRMGGWSGWWFL